MRRRLDGSDTRTGLVRKLPLFVAYQSDLKIQIGSQWHYVCHRIIEIKGVAGMNLRSLLRRVGLKHLER